ncbi:MAG: class I SAM-dependent methyltransferase [Elainellaceae cyanobacterium]
MTANAQTFWLENLKSASNYNRWIFSQIRPFLGDEVLEVGCGNGNFSVLLAKRCDRLVALDLDDDYVEMTRARLKGCSHVKVMAADATALDSPHTFNSVVMLDVLEHIEADVATIVQLARSLKPGGNLIVKVPALQSLYSPMDAAIGHYRRYHKGNLSRAFQRAGLTVDKIWYFNLAGIPGWWLNGSVLKRTMPPSSQVGLFDRVVPALEVFEDVVSVPVGLSLFAVGQVAG